MRIPPTEAEIEQLFAGWREELATCRKFAPAARDYAAARLAADLGLRINEIRMLDLDDVRWDLGRFGKLNVRHGKGALLDGQSLHVRSGDVYFNLIVVLVPRDPATAEKLTALGQVVVDRI